MAASELSPAHLEELLRHREWLTRLAYRLIGNQADAEDLAQSAIERTLRRSPDHPEGMRSWLATTVRNLASNLRRDRARAARKQAEIATRAESELLQDSRSPNELAAELLAAQGVLLEGLNWLQEEHRTAIFLRYDRRLSFQEVGRELEISPEAARKRVDRALESLRQGITRRLGPGWREKMAAAFGLPLPLPLAGAPIGLLKLAAMVVVLGGAIGLAATGIFGDDDPAGAEAASALAEGAEPVNPATEGHEPPEAAAAATSGEEERRRILEPAAAPLAPVLQVRLRVEGGQAASGIELVARRGDEELRHPLSESAGLLRWELPLEWAEEELRLTAEGPGLASTLIGSGRELAAGEQWIRFWPGRAQALRVLDADTGASVPGAALTVSDLERSARRQSDDAGQLSFWLAGEQDLLLAPDWHGGDRFFVLAPQAPRSLHPQHAGGLLTVPVRPTPERLQLQLRVAGRSAAPTGARVYAARGRSWTWEGPEGMTELPLKDGRLDQPNPFPLSEPVMLWFVAPGHLVHAVPAHELAARDGEVELQPAGQSELQLTGPSGAPLGEVELRWRSTQGRMKVSGVQRVEQDGRTSLPTPPDRRGLRWDLEAWQGGERIGAVAGVSAESLPADRPWRWRPLRQLVPVELELVDLADRPLPGRRLRAELDSVPAVDDFGPLQGSSALTDADGRARLLLEPGGQGQLYVALDETGRSESLLAQALSVPPSGSLAIRLILPAGQRRLDGQLRRADGSPAAGFELRAYATSSELSPGLESLGWCFADADGGFALDGLPEAPIRLEVWDGPLLLDQRPLPGPQRGLVHTLPATFSLRVVANLADGRAADDGFEVRHLPAQGSPRRARSQDGRPTVLSYVAMGPGWLLARSLPDGAWLAKEVEGALPEVALILHPGREEEAQVGLDGLRLPAGLRCTVVGQPADSPLGSTWTELDGSGNLILEGAPLGAFSIQLVDATGAPYGDPVEVP